VQPLRPRAGVREPRHPRAGGAGLRRGAAVGGRRAGGRAGVRAGRKRPRRLLQLRHGGGDGRHPRRPHLHGAHQGGLLRRELPRLVRHRAGPPHGSRRPPAPQRARDLRAPAGRRGHPGLRPAGVAGAPGEDPGRGGRGDGGAGAEPPLRHPAPRLPPRAAPDDPRGRGAPPLRRADHRLPHPSRRRAGLLRGRRGPGHLREDRGRRAPHGGGGGEARAHERLRRRRLALRRRFVSHRAAHPLRRGVLQAPALHGGGRGHPGRDPAAGHPHVRPPERARRGAGAAAERLLRGGAPPDDHGQLRLRVPLLLRAGGPPFRSLPPPPDPPGGARHSRDGDRLPLHRAHRRGPGDGVRGRVGLRHGAAARRLHPPARRRAGERTRRGRGTGCG
jgi:hypothetical protein